MAFEMKNMAYWKAKNGGSPAKKKVDLTKTLNPYTKAVKNKDYKIDEKEEQVIENMSNNSNFDGHIEMQINKLKKKKEVKKPKSKIGMKQWYEEEEEETKRINQ